MNQSGTNRPLSERSGATPIHVQLERCIRECDNRTGLKIIVAPSSHAARMIRTALARQGCPLVNVEAVTPLELARHVGRTMVPDDRRRTMSSAEGALLVRRLMSETDSEAGWLLGRAAFPVWAAIQELRTSGVSASDVIRAARRPHERMLAGLLDSCERHLRAFGLRDGAHFLLSAIDLANDFASRRPPELVAILDQVRVSEQEERLIRIISGAAGRSVRIGTGEADVPSDRAAVVFSDWPVARGSDENERGTGADVPAAIRAGERREEIASVLADIVARGTPFDDVEIAYTAEDPYRSEIGAACGRYGIPFSDGGRIRLVSTRTGAAVAAALKWVAGGYPVDGLVSMLRIGFVHPAHGTAVDVAAVLDRFPVSLAAAARPGTRDRLVERARQEFVDIGHLTDAFRTMDALRRIVPGSGRKPGGELLSFVKTFLRDHVRVDSAADEAAALVLRDLAFLETFDTGGGSGGIGDAAAVASFAVQVLERLSVPSAAGSGGVSIVPLDDAGFGRADRIYVVGLDDQSCSERNSQDSLLTDSFRERLREMTGRGPLARRDIPVSALVDRLLLSRPDSVTLCRSMYDISIDRPLFPGIRAVDTGTEEPQEGAARPVLDATDGFLNDPTGSPVELAGQLFDHIERGRIAAEAKASIEWTEYDGLVDARTVPLPPTHSPSALETLASCPYRYFLRYVLRVPVHKPADPDEWMTSRDRGQILHELFERHALRRMETGRVPAMDDLEWMETELDDLLERFMASNPAPSDALFYEARRTLRAAGAVYLHAEMENAHRVPHAAEFRVDVNDDADAPPFELDLGDDLAIRLTGRIDRIDRLDSGRLAVTDFKTGKRRGLKESDLTKLDTRLQWAVYARLAREHFGIPVELSGYLFTSVEELGLRREAAPPTDEELDDLLRQMLERARSGFFARSANPYGEPCTYCDFKAVCGDLHARRDEMRAKACQSVESDDERAPLIESWNGFSRRYCS